MDFSVLSIMLSETKVLDSRQQPASSESIAYVKRTPTVEGCNGLDRQGLCPGLESALESARKSVR